MAIRSRIAVCTVLAAFVLANMRVASEPDNTTPTLRSLFGTPAPQALLDAIGALPENGALVFIPARNAPAPAPKRLALTVSRIPAPEHTLRAVAFADDHSITPDLMKHIPPKSAREALQLNTYLDSATHHFGLYISADGRIRRAEFFENPDDAIVLFSRVQDWHRGQAIYAAVCSRCHGKDGTDTSYPLIKTLNGIAARYDDLTIIRETAATAIVNIHQYSEEEQFGLAVFVAGL